MIYLLATSMLFVEDMHTEVILKIGYSDDSRGNQRFKDYESSGMTIKVLQVLQGGSQFLEGIIQKYFSKYSIPGRSREWFFYTEDIIDFFKAHKTCGEILRYLIDNYMFDSNEEPTFYLLPGRNEQLDSIIQSYVSDRGETEVFDFLYDLRALPHFCERLVYVCDTLRHRATDSTFINELLEYLPDEFLRNCQRIGLDRDADFRDRLPNMTGEDIRREIFGNNMHFLIYRSFEVGKWYGSSLIIRKLRLIYSIADISDAPKSNYINLFFNTKPMTSYEGLVGYEILSRKE